MADTDINYNSDEKVLVGPDSEEISAWPYKDKDNEPSTSFASGHRRRVGELEVEPEAITEGDLEGSDFQEGKTFDLGAMPTEDSSAQQLLSRQTALSTSPMESQIQELKIGGRDPSLVAYEEKKKALRSKQPLDFAANKLRRNIAEAFGEDSTNISGGLPYRTKQLSGSFDTDVPALEADFDASMSNIKKSLNEIVFLKDDSDNTQKQQAVDALGAFTEQSAVIPKAFLVAREAATNVATKDIPWLVKNVLMKLPAITFGDAPWETMAHNVMKYVVNNGIDFIKWMSGKNFSNMKSDLNDIIFRQYTFDGIEMPLYQHIERFDKEVGISKYAEDWGKEILKGMQVPEDQRSLFDHIVRFGVEIGSPIFGIPFGGVIRTVSRNLRNLDNFNIDRSIKMYNRNFKGTDQELKIINDGIRAEILGTHKSLGKGKLGGTVIELGNGIRHTIPPFNKFTRKEGVKEIGAYRHMNMVIGAGVGGGIVYDTLINMPEYKKYAPVAYIASIVGAIKGGSGLVRATTRVPGLLAPLGADVVGIVGYSAVGLSRVAGNWSSRGILKHAGDFMRMLRMEGSTASFIDSKWGMFIQAQSAGVSVTRALSDVVKNGGAGLQKLIHQEQLPEKAYKHLAKFYRAMDETEKEQLNEGLNAATRLAESLNKMAGGKGMQEHFFMLDQVLNLSVIKSQRQILMSSIKFGKEGFLSRFSSWGSIKAGKMLSHMDQYNKVVEQQVGSLAVALKSLRKTQEVGTKGSKERVRLANMIDNYIDETLAESSKFNEQLAGYQQKSKLFTGNPQKDKFVAVLKGSQNDNKLLDPDLMPSRFRNNPVKFFKNQHEAIDADLRIKAGTLSREILDSALSAAWSRSNKLYNKINQNSKFANKDIPVNNIVNSLSESMLASSNTASNIITRKLSGLDSSQRSVREQFIEATKRNHLDSLDFDKLVHKADEVYKHAHSFGDSFEMTFKGNSIKAQDLEEILKRAKDEGPMGAGSDTLKDLLSNLGSTEKKASKIINNIVPSVMPLKELRSIISNLGKKSSTKRVKDVNSRTHEISEELANFNKAYDIDAADPITKELLKKQGLNVEDIKEYMVLKRTADDNYKNEIGYVWKAKLGEDLTIDPRVATPKLTDEQSLLHFLQASKNRVSGEETVYGAEAFNRAFPSTGTTDVPRKLDDGSEVIEVIENSVLRDRAKKMLLHQMGLIFMYGGKGGTTFAMDITPTMIESFIKAKIIPKHIGHNLKIALSDLQTSVVKSEEVIEAEIRLKNGITEIINIRKTADKGSWLAGIASKGDDFPQEQFVEALVFGVGKTSSTTTARASAIKTELKEDINIIGDAADEVVNPSTAGRYNVDDTLRAVDELPIRQELRDENINIFVDAVKSKNISNPAEAKEAMSMLDDAQDLILNYGYNKSFQFSNIKATFGGSMVSGNKAARNIGNKKKINLEEVGKQLEGQEDSYKFHKLRMDVDQVNLATFVDESSETLEKLAVAKLEIARASKDPVLIKSATDDLKMLKQLKEINSMAAIVKGETSTLGVAGQPTDFAGSQIISRVYSWARGVVGMQYLATEAAYKSWHLGHAAMMKEILFNPASVDILHKIAVRKGRMSAVDFKTLSALVLKSFSRGHAYANAQDKREGELALIARVKENIVEEGIELAEEFFSFVDPVPHKQHRVSIFTNKGTIRGPQPKPSASWTKSRPKSNPNLNHY